MQFMIKNAVKKLMLACRLPKYVQYLQHTQ